MRSTVVGYAPFNRGWRGVAATAAGRSMTSPPSPRQRNAARSRTAILNAAEQLFAEHGLDGTSLQAIGAAAGVSRGLPSYLFGSKARVYRAVLDRLLQDEQATVAAAQAALAGDTAPSEAVFAAAIRSHLVFLTQRPAFLKLLAREALSGGAALRTASSYLGVLAAGRAIITQEQERGGIHTDNADQLLLSILALCWFPLTHIPTIGRSLGVDPADPSFVERQTAWIVRLLFDGIRANG